MTKAFESGSTSHVFRDAPEIEASLHRVSNLQKLGPVGLAYYHKLMQQAGEGGKDPVSPLFGGKQPLHTLHARRLPASKRGGRGGGVTSGSVGRSRKEKPSGLVENAEQQIGDMFGEWMGGVGGPRIV